MKESADMRKSDKNTFVGSLWKSSSEVLGDDRRLFLMIGSLLICLFASVAISVVVYSIRTIVLALAPIPATAQKTVDIVFSACSVTLVAVFGAPLFWGRLRMAGLLAEGARLSLRDVFYYYTSGPRLNRAAGITGFALLLAAPFLGVGLAALAGLDYLYDAVFMDLFPPPIAISLGVFGVVLLVLLFFLFLYILGPFFPTIGLAVGNENMKVMEAAHFSYESCKKQKKTLFMFTIRAVLWLILSLLTVGVLYLLYFSHVYLMSYLRLAKALCSKEESQ